MREMRAFLKNEQMRAAEAAFVPGGEASRGTPASTKRGSPQHSQPQHRRGRSKDGWDQPQQYEEPLLQRRNSVGDGDEAKRKVGVAERDGSLREKTAVSGRVARPPKDNVKREGGGQSESRYYLASSRDHHQATTTTSSPTTTAIAETKKGGVIAQLVFSKSLVATVAIWFVMVCFMVVFVMVRYQKLLPHYTPS